MKNILTYIFLICSIFNSSAIYADIEKGKWNFVKDTDYCYIGSMPIEEIIPEGKNRDQTYILVYRINKNPNSIVQIVAGYPFKKEKKVSVSIDSSNFLFYSEDDTAWTKDDDTVIYAMKKGNELTINGESSRGTKTLDTYTLKGFTSAYNKLIKDC